MDYKQKKIELEQGMNKDGEFPFWKPEEEKNYILTTLSEMEEYTFNFNGEEKKRAKVLIEDEKRKKYIWSFPIGKTLMSTYGQFVKIGALNNNSIKNIPISVTMFKQNIKGKLVNRFIITHIDTRGDA